MKVTFIRPNMHPERSADALEPLVFAILRSLTPPHVETVLVDERLEPIPYDEPTDLVALTVETYTARRAYQIASEYRRRQVPVVMGGYHPTFLPEEAGRFADAVVQGDAEGGLWAQVVADAERGRLQRLYRHTRFPSLEGVIPDRSIFAGKPYGPVALAQYGRGCRYACEFCSIHAFYGSCLRQRPVREVISELERVERPFVFFVDDNIFVDEARARALFTDLKPLGLRWSCQISVDVARDPELVRLMQASGCTSAIVGFESLNPRNLVQMKKGWVVKQDDYDTAVKVLQDAGVMIYGTFVHGYDEDTPESFDASLQFAERHKFYLANFNPLTPTPGARLYDRLEREGRLIYDRWWLDPTFRYGHATFRPRRMTAEDLTEGCYRARTAFNSCGSILRRLWDTRTHLRSPYRLGLYLLSNWVSRREIHGKQGLPLGAPASLQPILEQV